MFTIIKKQFYAMKARQESGQSLVEMAIITPLLLFLLLGVFEVGSAVRSYLTLVNANREITRFAVRPGYLDFTDLSSIDDSYLAVRNWIDVTLGQQLDLDFSDTGNINDTGNATLIVSHVVVDTGFPCEDMDNCNCDAFDNPAHNPYPDDDIIIHPGKPGMWYQAKRYGPAETVTGQRTSRIDYEALVTQELIPQNNKFNCELIKKGGVASANNIVITELFVDQPQLFGFPFISNPYTDPLPLYSHTTMRLVSGARDLLNNIDTVGPVCMAYPFTFHQNIFADPDNPAVPQWIDAFEGDSPGNFGWITWNPDSGNNNAVYVEKELKIPQLSLNDYTNVADPSDHTLSIGDWVSTKPGVANSNGVDEQLQLLVGKEIIIPVYSNNPGNGAGSYYVISHFAKIKVDQICLPRNGSKCDGENKKQIKATFLGYVDDTCTDAGSGPASPNNNNPVAADDTIQTTKNTPVVMDVLFNDSDVDGDELMIMSVTELGSFKGTLQVDADGKSISYVPKNNDTGTYQFTYTISDGKGGTATATVTVMVLAGSNNPPVAANDTATTVEDTAITINVLNNDSDPDGDLLSVSAVSAAAHGSVTNNGTNVTYTPGAGYTGSDSFTYTITDGKGGTATATVTITVNPLNRPPVAVNDSYTTNEDSPLTVHSPGVLSNDSDPNGDAITAIKVSDPAKGAVMFNANGSFTYTPQANFFGTDSFTYKANDGVNDSAIATVSIVVNPVNDPPVAVNDNYSVRMCRTLTVAAPGVLANDTDVDTVVLTAVKVSNPAQGSLTFNSDGSFTYTPAATGSPSFTYKANDGQADSNVATVSITVNANTRPTANNDTARVKKNRTLTIDVSGLIDDADGDTLTLTNAVITSGGGTVTSYSGTTINYTAPDEKGEAVIRYTISDGCSTRSANITVRIRD